MCPFLIGWNLYKNKQVNKSYITSKIYHFGTTMSNMLITYNNELSTKFGCFNNGLDLSMKTFIWAMWMKIMEGQKTVLFTELG
jgi:hypothetical protein